MIHKKLYVCLMFLSIPIVSNASDPFTDDDDTQQRSIMFQHDATLSNQSNLLLTTDEKTKGLSECSLTTYSILLSKHIKQILFFDGNVTIEAGHIFKLDASTNVTALSATTNPITVFAFSHEGFPQTHLKNLQLTNGATRINACTSITGSLIVNESTTIEGSLLVNGSISIAQGKTLTVQGDLICNGQNLHLFVNKGTISATGSITIQKYAALNDNTRAISNQGTISTTSKNITFKDNTVTGAHGVVIHNETTISTTSGDIIIANNKATGSNSSILENIGTAGTITSSSGSIFITENSAQQRVIYNAVSARLSTEQEGIISIRNNNSAGEILCNNGFASHITTENGNFYFEKNIATARALVNMNSAYIESSNRGSLLIQNNHSQAATIFNGGSEDTRIQTSIGNIVIQDNTGLSAGLHNTQDASIKTTKLGTISLNNNHASGGYGVLNDYDATIQTIAAGNIMIQENRGEQAGIKNDRGATIQSANNILFRENNSRDGSGVMNSNGASITATDTTSHIIFKNNNGKTYGVYNLVEVGSQNSEIRTTDATTSLNNATSIIFIGNSGSVAHTKNETAGGTGSSYIISGAASGTTGQGTICYDAQQTVSTTGSAVTHPTPQLCTA